MTTCRSCRAPIVWTLTANGKNSPVDAKPSIEGNLALTPRGFARRSEPAYSSRVVPASEREAGRKYFISHFATCPQHGIWRKPEGEKEDERLQGNSQADGKDSTDLPN